VSQDLKRLSSADSFIEVIDTTEKSAMTPQDATVENLRTRAGGISRNRCTSLKSQSSNQARDCAARMPGGRTEPAATTVD